MASLALWEAVAQGQVWRGDAAARAHVPVVSSGLAMLDAALAQGGLPVGAVTELRAPMGHGCLSLAMHVCAQVLVQPRLRAAVVDGAGTLHGPAVLEAGVAPGRLWCVRPKARERTVGLALRLLKSCAFKVVVVDHAFGPPTQPHLQVKRLAVAAQEAQAAVLLLCGSWGDETAQPLAGAVRLRLRRHAGSRVEIAVEKQRGASFTPSIQVAWPWVDNLPQVL